MPRRGLAVLLVAFFAVGVLTLFGAAFSLAGSVDLPKTGQTTCYDASGNVISCPGTGQDGDIQAGVAWPSPRFTDNGDGTVTDNLTGLMWLKDANCFGYKPWQSALDAVTDFNANPGNYSAEDYAASYSGWRLPNVNELESLVNAEEACPATWLNNQGFANVQSYYYYYWSSTTRANNTNYAWGVYMRYGNVNNDFKSTYKYVWPVRSSE